MMLPLVSVPTPAVSQKLKSPTQSLPYYNCTLQSIPFPNFFTAGFITELTEFSTAFKLIAHIPPSVPIELFPI